MNRKIEYVKTIDHLERLRRSVNGNPRFLIHFTDGTMAQTQSDASCAYCLDNHKNIGVPVLVQATPAGRVYSVEPIK